MSLADHVRTLGRGPGRSRALTRDESEDAMTLMLSGDAAPEAIGALLMLLRMKGETADEIAGFAHAARQAILPVAGVELDWPSYAAGRTRGQPWFLLSARLVAMAGHSVLLHGWNGSDGAVRAGLRDAGISVARTVDDGNALLRRDGIAYLPLEEAHPRLFGLLSLRAVLGLWSCVNTVCRMLNPGAAPASVQGVFHPSYRLLQADAAARLGWPALSVIKGGGGEFERHPGKQIDVFGLRHGQPWQAAQPTLLSNTRRLAETDADLATLWTQGAPGSFEESVVLGTAALALETLGHADGRAEAQRHWDARP
ncbi:glycosyl transferase family protein, partial [Citreimonas sp.]|uniref:glycosyl transferase family protein n=1 Tax=Citreimonas sp. TaxID=3036715 RepID=UPI0035C82ECF